VLYEFELGKTAAEMTENINLAFEEGCVNVKTLQRWCAQFKIGDFSLENEPRGRPDRIRNIIENNPRRRLKFSTTSVPLRSFKDLNFVKNVHFSFEKIGQFFVLRKENMIGLKRTRGSWLLFY
ncbi:Histone-lysine N-methyltransferase SETMAR, partial [Habropoda laboriosa]